MVPDGVNMTAILLLGEALSLWNSEWKNAKAQQILKDNDEYLREQDIPKW